MVRETSVEAYKAVLASGFVAKKNKQVYSIFYEHGPLTSAEAYKLIPGRETDQKGNIRARVHELVKDGLLKELGKRQCTVTGMTVYFYDVTLGVPVKFEKPKRHKCKYCKGKGYTEEAQGKLF